MEGNNVRDKSSVDRMKKCYGGISLTSQLSRNSSFVIYRGAPPLDAKGSGFVEEKMVDMCFSSLMLAPFPDTPRASVAPTS